MIELAVTGVLRASLGVLGRVLAGVLSAGVLGTTPSITHGATQTVNSAPTTRLVITGASYAADWKTPSLPGFEITNRGVGGEQTHQVLARFDRDVVAARPDAVLIWGHINNIHRAPDGQVESAKQRAMSDYREMVRRARAANIRVVLATEVTLSEAVGWTGRLAAFIGKLRGKNGYSDWVNGHVRAVNAWLRTYAAEERIPLLDFEQVCDDGAGFRKREYSSEDGSHISAAGYTALTKYTQSQLKQKLRTSASGS